MDHLPKISPEKYRMKGMGDVVHAIANPIAKAIDSIAGSNISNCGGCSRRRAMLNDAIPFTLANQEESDRIPK